MARRSSKFRASLLCFFFALLLFTVASAATTKKPPLKPVNINAATSEELQQVPGIGPATAEKILQMRKSYGSFKSVDDLLAIKGIGKKRLDKMRKYLTVGKPAAASKIPASKTQSKEPVTPSEPPPPPNQP
jgi:competence protein ComEA